MEDTKLIFKDGIPELALIKYRMEHDCDIVYLKASIQTRNVSDTYVLGQWSVSPGPCGMDYHDGRVCITEYRNGRCYATMYNAVTGDECWTTPCGYGETPVFIQPKITGRNGVAFYVDGIRVSAKQIGRF
jgi:hypothetical protein